MTSHSQMCDKLRNDLRAMLPIKKHRIQCIKENDEYLKDRLEDGDVLVVADKTLLDGNLDLKLPASAMLINYDTDFNIHTLMARISRLRRGGGFTQHALEEFRNLSSNVHLFLEKGNQTISTKFLEDLKILLNKND